MIEISKIRKLSLWIFFIPLISINLCLLISTNFSLLENTFLEVDQIGRSNFTIPYLDGSLSISRASRTFPQFLIFKPAMIITGFLLILYWKNNNNIINKFYKTSKQIFKFTIFGILSAVFLIIHSILLGLEFDIKLFKFLRRVVLLGFIIFEIVAQGILVFHFYKLKHSLSKHINENILRFKISLVFILAVVALASVPFLISTGNTHLKHGLEWNYFVGVILFYLLTRLFWKRTT